MHAYMCCFEREGSCCFSPTLCGDPSAPRCGTSPRSRCWCQWDPCGWTCAVATYLLMGFGWYATVVHVLRPWRGAGSLNEIAFSALMALALWAHTKGQFTDPGAIPPNASPVQAGDGARLKAPVVGSGDDPLMPMCLKCRAYKPPHAHHCSTCNRCVSRMDHHCPWLNSCVGASNLKFFLLFCAYICVSSLYALALAIVRMLSCAHYGNELSVDDFSRLAPAYCRGNISSTLVVVFLSVECVLFGLFTCCMLCDQYPNVTTGQTHIDTYKMSAADKARWARARTLRENLAMVFGDGGFSLLWFVPVDPKWKRPELLLEYVVVSVDGDDDDATTAAAAAGADLEAGRGPASASATSTEHHHEVPVTVYEFSHPAASGSHSQPKTL